MRKKIYGQEQITVCITCGKRATATNQQQLPSCATHIQVEHNLKCVCKEWLDQKKSKYGVFFVCHNCGPVSYKKAMEVNNLPLPSLEEL